MSCWFFKHALVQIVERWNLIYFACLFMPWHIIGCCGLIRFSSLIINWRWWEDIIHFKLWQICLVWQGLQSRYFHFEQWSFISNTWELIRHVDWRASPWIYSFRNSGGECQSSVFWEAVWVILIHTNIWKQSLSRGYHNIFEYFIYIIFLYLKFSSGKRQHYFSFIFFSWKCNGILYIIFS